MISNPISTAEKVNAGIFILQIEAGCFARSCALQGGGGAMTKRRSLGFELDNWRNHAKHDWS